jgi:hypothetical protein
MKFSISIPFSTAQRTCSSALAPCLLQRMWPLLFMRWSTKFSAADSAAMVENWPVLLSYGYELPRSR